MGRKTNLLINIFIFSQKWSLIFQFCAKYQIFFVWAFSGKKFIDLKDYYKSWEDYKIEGKNLTFPAILLIKNNGTFIFFPRILVITTIFFKCRFDHLYSNFCDYTGKFFSKTTFAKKWIHIHYFDNFLHYLLKSFLSLLIQLFRKIYQKKRKEMGFYPPIFKNSLESWKKIEYPLCKIIASQKYLPAAVPTISKTPGFAWHWPTSNTRRQNKKDVDSYMFESRLD